MTMLYELKPWLLLCLGVAGIAIGSLLAMVSGGTLITASLAILDMRWESRHGGHK